MRLGDVPIEQVVIYDGMRCVVARQEDGLTVLEMLPSRTMTGYVSPDVEVEIVSE